MPIRSFGFRLLVSNIKPTNLPPKAAARKLNLAHAHNNIPWRYFHDDAASGLTITSVSWIHAALVTSQTVSCTDDVTNLVTNPEFNSGLTGWSTYGNNWAAVSPSSSSDGMAYDENVITSENSFYVCQTVSGCDIGEEYTVSVDAGLAVGSGATTTQCIFEVLIHMNGGSYTVQQSTFSITSSSSSWQTLSGTFKPTYSSITLYALAYCQSGTSTNAQSQFRDVQFGQTTSVCTTSTPSSTLTTVVGEAQPSEFV